MTDQANLALREYVTSIGFALTLSKRMIQVLVALDHFGGDFCAIVDWQNDPELSMADKVMRRRMFSHYVTSFTALEGRGLVVAVHKRDKDGYANPRRGRHRITRAGRHVVGLLKEAGLYQDWIKEMGLL